MEYTQNYHLPQWVKSDRIMMEDFNDAMSAMEDGMTASTQTANAARTDAAQAKQIAQQTAGSAFTPDNMPYVVGTYSGGGRMPKTIVTGFRPSCVIICSAQHATNADSWTGHIAVATEALSSSCVEMADNGFVLVESSFPYPLVNAAGGLYSYIAFR